MRTKKAGYATDLGQDGADVYLIQFGILPTYYVTKASARRAGWQSFRGNLDDVLPGKMIGGDIYQNREGKLPSGPGRIWYEADINYDGGFRNLQRILYSNDGLIFVSYDHYQTFYEITQ
ncbi:MAG: ribonuclease [Clostridia bacterium]|nr:ribonuclease [Clostridia bacterium]